MSNQWPGGQGTETDPIAGPDLAAHEAATDDVHGTGTNVTSDNIDQFVAGAPDASTTVKGRTKLATAPVSPTNPIAVGDNDPRNSDQRVPTDGSVTAAKVNTALKPSGSAAGTDESLRRLGTGATHAAAGDDSRFPSAGEKNALAGTSGTPGSGNKYVTDGDARNTDARTPADGSVTAAKVAGNLKPSGSAAAGDESLRALGTSASTAAAGNDSRLSDTRVPTDASVTAAKVAASLKPSGSAAAGDEALRALGTSASTAAAGNDARLPAGTTKGDLWVFNGSIWVRKAAGVNGSVLKADSSQSDGLAWSLHGYGLQSASGQYTQLVQGVNANQTAGTLNQVRTYPFVFAGAITISAIYCNVTTAGTAGNVLRLGIYESDSGGRPGALLVEFGTVALDSTGEKSITSLSQVLVPGRHYHMAYVAQGSGTPGSISVGQRPLFGGPNGATNWTDPWFGAVSTTTVSGALPGTFPWAGTLGGGSPQAALIIVKAA